MKFFRKMFTIIGRIEDNSSNFLYLDLYGGLMQINLITYQHSNLDKEIKEILDETQELHKMTFYNNYAINLKQL